MLDPDVVMRVDAGAAGGMRTIIGAAAVAGEATNFRRFSRAYTVEPVLVNGMVGLVGRENGRPRSVLGFTITDGRITALEILNDPERLALLDLSAPAE
ncbi:hypothetical protein ACWDRB_26045 [Nonomuraea sp. NPDC003707]